MSQKVFMLALLSSMMAVKAFALDVRAVKNCSTTVTNPSAPAGGQETWCTGPSDLMNVAAFALAGENLQICTSTESNTYPRETDRVHGVSILDSQFTQVAAYQLAGVEHPGLWAFYGGGCVLWSVPADGTYIFRLMTYLNIGGNLAWEGPRQIVVYALP